MILLCTYIKVVRWKKQIFKSISFFNKSAAIKCVLVTKGMLNECNAEMEDSDGIVTFVRNIDGIEVACILKEFSDNEIKVGLRSKKYIDVANICFKFGGGGHKRAAGCTIYDNIDKAKALILEEIIKSFR